MHKKHFLLLIFCFTSIQWVYSGDSIPGKIVFYRELGLLDALKPYKIYANNVLVVKLRNSSYYEYQCPPGDYSISLKENKGMTLNLHVEAGKSYYIKSEFVFKFLRPVPNLIIVDSIWASPEIYGSGLRRIKDANKALDRPKSRIGINVDFGVPLDPVPVINTTNSNESSVWFGGGFSMGVKYGYELNKHFDLALDLNYQGSRFIPSANNEAIFSKGNIWITPSFIIPFDGGETMRLKLGGGVNYNFAPRLKIDQSSTAGGITDTWKYKNAFGYHFRIVYELNHSDYLSNIIGIGYSNVQYKFSGADNTAPNTQEYLKPNGSAIDFYLGFYFHF